MWALQFSRGAWSLHLAEVETSYQPVPRTTAWMLKHIHGLYDHLAGVEQVATIDLAAFTISYITQTCAPNVHQG